MPSSTRKKKTQQNKILFIFLSTFFVSLVTLIYLATAFTPKIDIDVEPANTLEQSIPSDDDNLIAEAEYKSIDSRLKDIQRDDQLESEDSLDTTSDIIANLKKMKEEAIAKQMREDEKNPAVEDDIQVFKSKEDAHIKLDAPRLATPQHPKSQITTQTPIQDSSSQSNMQTITKMTKVYVGKYADFDKAAAVQDSLVKSSLVSSPFIKNLNGYYVIQVGSFSNQEAAQNVAELLISNGYAAKMILE